MARVRPGEVWEFYGSTEGQFTVCGPDEWLEHPGTVGRARPGRRLSVSRRWRRATRRRRDDGSGTVWCDMPPFAHFSYWGDDEATRAAWRGSACTVGDLGRLDEAGYLYLTGRRHDLIISGGVNVYPAEVEAVLAAVPGVRELAVFGLPDEQWGQRVCVAYVADPSVDEASLRSVAEVRLAPYKRPEALRAGPPSCRTPRPASCLRRAIPEHLGLDWHWREAEGR